ncbi:DUF3301 domain-containing protein [Eionea flava]
MDIYQLIATSIIGLIIWLIWQHNNISISANKAAKHRCQKEDVQLLDQTVVLRKIRIIKSKRSFIALQRTYQFEFSSVGDYRYKGTIRMQGRYIESIELAPFKVTAGKH